MRKFFGILFLFFLINACDDGDVAVQDISFEQVEGLKCNDNGIVYKIKGNEVLILNIPKDSLAFKDDLTIVDKPRIYSINSNTTVTYRAYNSVPTGANFCGAIPPATPIVIEEWTAIGGTIEITSTITKTTDETTKAETITGYNHLVILKNITFKKPNGEQFYEEFRFGNYKTTITPLNFTVFTNNIKKCNNGTSSNLTSNNGLSSLISFDNNPDLIQPILTNGTPRVATISTNNNLYYRVFGGLSQTTDLTCAKTFLSTDTTLQQEWKATTGTVEVTTSPNGAAFIHEVRLKGVKFKKGNSEFYLGDNFLLGKI